MKRISIALRFSLIISIIAAVLISAAGCSKTESVVALDKNIIVIVPHGFGINYYLIQDVMDQYGWHTTYAGLTDSVQVCGPFAQPRGGMAMKVDTLLSQMTDFSSYDAVFILTSTQFSGDDPFADIMASDHAMNLIASAAKEDIPIFASCAGVRVLGALGLLSGKSITGSPKYQAEFEAAGAVYLGKDQAPQIIGNLITSSRGQYNNVPNGVALVTAMEMRESRVRPKLAQPDLIRSAPVTFEAADAVWAKTYGGRSADGANAVCETSDSGLLIVGYTFSSGAGNADILAIKTDSAGAIQWVTSQGGAGTEYGYACAEVSDGYLITGYTTSTKQDALDKDVYLLKLDFDGDLLWSRTYGGPLTDAGTALCVLDDGYAVSGFTESSGAGETDIYLLRTDFDGEEKWSKTFGGEFTDMGNTVMAGPDGGIVVGGNTNSVTGNSDYYLIRTDANGNQLWANPYYPVGEHGYGFDWGTQACATPDGGWYCIGYTDCLDVLNIYVVKVDSEGNQLWAKSFGTDFYDYGNAVCATPDGGALVCGATKELFNNNDLYLVKLDAKGDVIWEKKVGGPGKDWASSICLTSDGNCVIVGHTNSCGSGSLDVMVVKVDIQ